MSQTADVMQTQKVRSSWLRRGRTNEALLAYLFILPSLIGFITFYAVPADRGLMISFTNWDLLGEAQFVGFANYQQLFQDDLFWLSLRVTLYYVLLNIPLQTALAVGLAVLMDRLTQSLFVRGVLVLPWLIPNVVVALLWL
ncbi:MAG: sugar ABC transporter permease, partial [Chloroflexota bacterium]